MAKNAIALSLTACLVAVVLYMGARAYAAYTQGYSWQEMDWNSDGSTSLSEFLESSDIGKRQVTKDGVQCTEYFEYKDGLPVKTVCAGPTKTVRVRILPHDTCVVADLKVACPDVGQKLRDLGTPLDADIHLVGDPDITYESVRAAIESLQRAGFKLKFGEVGVKAK